jgi:hypothetical protein
MRVVPGVNGWLSRVNSSRIYLYCSSSAAEGCRSRMSSPLEVYLNGDGLVLEGHPPGLAAWYSPDARILPSHTLDPIPDPVRSRGSVW